MSQLKASLEAAILEWINESADSGVEGWSDFWYDSELEQRMADAAWAVFKAARDVQKFKDEQEKTS